MSAASQSAGGQLIAPHGGNLVDRTVSGDEAAALAAEAAGLPRVRMTEKQTADLDMIASGALSPLTGFMSQADYAATVESDAPRRRPAVGTPGDAGSGGWRDRRPDRPGRQRG